MLNFRRFLSALLFLTLGSTAVALSQQLSVDFRQAANNHRKQHTGHVYWVQSVLQQNNAQYFEGMSVPQRVMFANIPSTNGNNHTFTFSHKASQGSRHAYDYLTSYDQALASASAIGGPTVMVNLNPCGKDMGPPKSMLTTCASIHGGAHSYTVDIPDAMGSVLSHDVSMSIANYEARFGNRTIRLWGNAPITSAMLVFNGYSGNKDKTAEYSLMWTSASDAVLVEMAGHLSMGLDVTGAGTGVGYGNGLGAGSVTGAPFHFKLGRLDGRSLGSQDNQIQGSAIQTAISCDIMGPLDICAGTMQTYKFNTAPPAASYTWSLSANSSGATIVGSNTGQSVSVEAGSNAGSFTLTVEVQSGTQSVRCPVTVNVNAITSSLSHTPILCFGDNSTVTVSATGGTPPYTGTGTFTKPAGTHSFSIVDAKGCSITETITITEPSELVATATTSGITCNTNSGTVTITATGGTPPYTGTGTFPCTSGTQTFTVIDANGCKTTVSVLVRSVMGLSVFVNATPILCYGGTSTVTVSATGGTAPYTGVGTFTRGAGTYSFTVTDANNCSTTKTITITEPPQLTVAAAGATQIQCYGGTSAITVTAAGGTPPYTGTGSYNLSAGTHTLTVTDANNCTASTQVSLTEPSQQLTVSPAVTTAVQCYGGNATVTVSAAGGTPPYTGTGTFTRSAGTHTFTVTDANNCTATGSVTITQPAQALTVAATPASQVQCFGGTASVLVTATGGTPPYSGTGTFTLAAGTHTLTVADANNCSATVSITLTQPAQALAATAAITSSAQCYGGNATISVTASGGTPPYSGTGTFTRGAGTHTFTVTDANNCTTTTSVTVTQPSQQLAASATTASQILCHGGTTTVTVTASGGTPPYSGTGTYTLGAGTHTLTVTDANNCTTTASITLTQPAQGITVTAAATSQIQCYGGTATVTVSASGGTPPYSGTGTFTLGAGTHTLTVTDANNCSASTNITLSQPSQALAASATAATQVLCYGGTATVTVSATGGTPPYSGTGTFNLPAGTHNFTITDANNCTATASVTLTQPAQALTVSTTSSSILCHGNGSVVTVSATGGTPPYTGTGAVQRFAGTHIFTVTDANGCAASDTITITEPPALNASASAPPIACNNSTAPVTVTATGGTPPYLGTGVFQRGPGTHTFTVKDSRNCITTTTVTVAGAPILNVTASATPILCNGRTSTVTVTASGGTAPYTGVGTFTRSAGTHTFTVTDANNCSSSASVTITEPPAITITAASTPILCNGGNSTVSVSATGGTPPYSGTGTFTYGAGTYVLTVTDANSCTAADTLVISEPPMLTASHTTTPVLCNGGNSTVTIAATGGTPPYSGTGTFTYSAGTYTVSVTDANGCADRTTFTISEPPVLTAGAAATPILCHGGTSTVTVTASGGTPPYSGTGSHTRGGGSFSFTVTDANGCTASASVTIAEPPVLNATATAQSIQCNGGTTTVSVNATGGTPPYSGTGNFTRSAGTYVFTVTDANGCTDTASIVLSDPPTLVAAATASPILCNGGTSMVTVNATGGTPPYSGTGGFTRGAGTFSFTVTDANGCTSTTSVTITEPPALTADANAGPILCNGGTTTVTVTGSGGTPPYTGTGNFTRGSGQWTFTVTDANGCTAIAAVAIVEPPKLTADATALPILCHGGGTTVTVDATGGTKPYSGTGSFTRGPGTHDFIVTDANGCSDTVSIVLTEPPLLTAASTHESIKCNGGTAKVTVSANGGTPPYSGTGVYQRGAGTHTFTVTDANGCKATTTVTLTEPPVLTASATSTPILCNGDLSTITVTATGGTTPYTGVGTFDRGAGTHTFAVTDSNGCVSTVVITVIEPPELQAQLNFIPILCHGGSASITITATGGTPPYSGTGSFTRGPGNYTFTVKDANGCEDTLSVSVTEPPPLSAAATWSPILCYGDLSTVTVTATGGTAPYTGTGNYLRGAGTHTMLVTDANGCTATVVINIVGPPELIASGSAPSVACGKDTATVTISAMGGTPPYNGVGTFLRTGGTHTFIVTDANGCADTVQVTVAGPPPLFAAANATPILCNGGNSTVTITAWGGTPPYSGVGTYIRGAGTYTFTVTDANNCSDQVTITIVEPPVLTVICVLGDCINGVREISAVVTGGTPPYNYSWSSSQGNANTPTILVPCSFSGTVDLTVQDANYNPNDPNNSSCEANCSLTIQSKDTRDADVSASLEYALFKNYPNPFNPSTTIEYHVPEPSHVRLSIINTLGRTVDILVDEEVQSGRHTVIWNAAAKYGAQLPSGSYFYRIHATSLISDRTFIRERLMMLLK